MNMNKPVKALTNQPKIVVSLWKIDERKDLWHWDLHEGSADDVPLIHGRTLPWNLLRDAIWEAVEDADIQRAERS